MMYASIKTYTADEQAANRAKLVAALRSGDYEQGQGWLRRKDDTEPEPRYCCLGVACDISRVGEWDETDHYVTPDGMSDTHLPHDVRRWLGFATDNGALDDGDAIPTRDEDFARVLTDANDDGASFADIANVIEEDRIKTV